MILKVILCVQRFSNFGDFTVTCAPRMLEYICYEPFLVSKSNLQNWKTSYINWLKFLY